jgi:DNA-binding transcriptional regulator YiaG
MSSVDPVTYNLAARLRARRIDQLNLTQTEAASALGVSVRTLQNWEAGLSTPWPKNRRALVKFLNGDAA